MISINGQRPLSLKKMLIFLTADIDNQNKIDTNTMKSRE